MTTEEAIEVLVRLNTSLRGLQAALEVLNKIEDPDTELVAKCALASQYMIRAGDRCHDLMKQEAMKDAARRASIFLSW